MSEPLYELLPWDSEHFRCRIAQVKRGSLTQADMDVLVNCDEVDCFYLHVQPSDLATLTVLKAPDLLLADVRVNLTRTLSDPATSWSLQASSPRDVEELAAIARQVHHDSRFYFDPHFSPADSDRLYDIWIRKSCDGWADRVLVVRLEGQAAGYITCHLGAGHPGPPGGRRGEKEGRIGLVGLAERAQGQGLGSALVRGALAWFAQHRAESVRVGTQGRNVAAQRLYQSQGFQTQSLELLYHLWPRHTSPAL